MARREIESTTDSEFAQRASATQPYNTISITITTANPARQEEDGSTEASEPTVENNETLVPGRELQESMARYNGLVEQYKQDNPEFGAIVGQNIPISIAVRDEILRAPNGPAIATFLGTMPEIAATLFRHAPIGGRGTDPRYLRESRGRRRSYRRHRLCDVARRAPAAATSQGKSISAVEENQDE
jgi:hypothetical protein